MAETVRLARVTDLSGTVAPGTVRSAADLAFGYRRSSVVATDVVLSATFDLARGDRDASLRTIRDIVRWRREHQPGGQNAGSVFTNPPGDAGAPSAGRLVDDAGLRGFRLRRATVSSKHANFIQADPGGSADDVAALIELVRRRVEERSGVRLMTEIRMIGFPPPDPGPATPDPQPEHEVDS